VTQRYLSRRVPREKRAQLAAFCLGLVIFVGTVTAVEGARPAGRVLVGSSKTDAITGSGGPDRLLGYAGNDRILGKGGTDVLVGGPGADMLVGGAGDDTISADGDPKVRDTIICGGGIDTVTADATDLVAGDCEAVLRTRVSSTTRARTRGGGTTRGTSPSPTTSPSPPPAAPTAPPPPASPPSPPPSSPSPASPAADPSPAPSKPGSGSVRGRTLEGTSGADILKGTEGSDRIYGYAGNDQLHGNGGSDAVNGGPGDDVVDGGAGDDSITASGDPRDSDRISCGSGRDVVTADRTDAVGADCEVVRRGGSRTSSTPTSPPPPSPPPNPPSPPPSPPPAPPPPPPAPAPAPAPPPPAPSSQSVVTSQPWSCSGPVNLDLLKVTVSSGGNAVDLRPGCTGRIGRIEIDQGGVGDGIKIQPGPGDAHDLTIGGGYVRCTQPSGDQHLDGMQAGGGERITFRNVRFFCGPGGSGNNSQFFLTGWGGDEASDVVCDGCVLGPGSQSTLNIKSGQRSGARNTIVCKGQAYDIRVQSGASDPVNSGNTVVSSSDSRCQF